MMTSILLSALWFIIWILLSWPPDISQVLTGLCVSIFVTFMTIDLFTGQKPDRAGILSFIIKLPVRVFWFFVYLLVFVYECLKANVDVAFRVIHPALPIRPGTIKMKMNLISDTAITLLANSMTLTPGTTSIDVDKDGGYLYIHWLFVKDRKGEPYRLPAFEKYERILKKVFE